MKKAIMLLLLLVGIGCAAGGYYIFFYKPQQQNLIDEQEEEAQQEIETTAISDNIAASPNHPSTTKSDYYVNSAKLGVREAPTYSAFTKSFAYRGDKLNILEQRDGWGRISPYYVYLEDGPEVAEWVPMKDLLEVPPTISEQERIETVTAYIEHSDDFKQHFEVFIKITDQLLKEKTCLPEDFEETKGWVRSVTFNDIDAYFVYCGGLKQAHKIYLNAQTGAIFTAK